MKRKSDDLLPALRVRRFPVDRNAFSATCRHSFGHFGLSFGFEASTWLAVGYIVRVDATPMVRDVGDSQVGRIVSKGADVGRARALLSRQGVRNLGSALKGNPENSALPTRGTA